MDRRRGIFTLFVLLTAVETHVCTNSFAGSRERLNLNAEAEYTFSHFERDPEPTTAETGGNLSQQYKFYLEGGFLDRGRLDSTFGVLLSDLYRKDETDVISRSRIDYGPWLRIEALTRSETDEEIFFSGTVEPQSPIHTTTEKFDSQIKLDAATSVEYSYENEERKDLFLGTVVGERTKSQSIRWQTSREPLSLSSEYRRLDFTDLLGTRSDIESEDFNVDMYYKPRDFFSISGFFENNEDVDLDNDTRLKSKDSQLEFNIKPFRELKLRNRTALREDKDTKTGEDIANVSDEFIVNFDPFKQVSLECAYKRAEEDKDKDSSDIDSKIDETRVRLGLTPAAKVNIQTGYELTDKSSTSSAENIRETRTYSDVSIEPVENLRMGSHFSNTLQEDTFLSVTQADTSTVSGSVQYRPRSQVSIFVQKDTTKTNNPSTDSYTKTDTASSFLTVSPSASWDVSLRTSFQETAGSSEAALLERWLNSIEFDIDLMDSLKLTTEYGQVDSNGASASDERLYDVGFFYFLGNFDFSFRVQERTVRGAAPTEKSTILSSLKYKLSRDAVLNMRISVIDYTDKVTLTNSYDSKMFESSFSMHF